MEHQDTRGTEKYKITTFKITSTFRRRIENPRRSFPPALRPPSLRPLENKLLYGQFPTRLLASGLLAPGRLIHRTIRRPQRNM